MKISVKSINAGIARKQMTFSELASMCGLAKQSISAIIHRGSCSPKTAGKIAAALGLDVTEIIVTEEREKDG